VRRAAPEIGGGGGGRPGLAEAGGRNPDGLSRAFDIAKEAIAEALS
jgi:alanyl-tRNA synthetase